LVNSENYSRMNWSTTLKHVEVQERLLAQRHLTRDDVVLELGGAIGFIGLFCRKVIGVRHHLSVEANPGTLEELKRNYALNGLKPNVIQATAAAQDGVLELDVGGVFGRTRWFQRRALRRRSRCRRGVCGVWWSRCRRRRRC
jgi:hypothetical protein